MHYQTIIWDWNGTLLHDAGLCRRVMNGLLSDRKLPIMSKKRYEDIFDFPVTTYYQRLGFDFTRESFEALGNAFMAGYEESRLACRLQSGARVILQSLRKWGTHQAVLSAYRQDSLQSLLDEKQLSEYFDWIVGADDHYARGKAEQGRKLKRLLGPRKKILMIGDTLHDAEVADSINVDCVLVYSGHQSRRRIAGAGVRIFDNLKDLHHWLAGKT